jgi:hypothetical protein
MATGSFIAARGAQWMVVLTTALALLLPLPARCASCATAQDGCPRCIAATAEAEAAAGPARSCCERRNSTESPPDSNSDSTTLAQSHHTCGCSLQPVQRNVPPTEKASIGLELNAGLVQAVALPTTAPLATGAASACEASALPPPIPHRILHCSWII